MYIDINLYTKSNNSFTVNWRFIHTIWYIKFIRFVFLSLTSLASIRALFNEYCFISRYFLSLFHIFIVFSFLLFHLLCTLFMGISFLLFHLLFRKMWLFSVARSKLARTWFRPLAHRGCHGHTGGDQRSHTHTPSRTAYANAIYWRTQVNKF